MKVKVIFATRYNGQECLGESYISGVLKLNGCQVEAVDAEYRSVMARLDPDRLNILAYSAPSNLFPDYYRLNSLIRKKHNVFSVFGGPHATLHPDIVTLPGIDGICLGEGEMAMLELVQNMERGQPVSNIRNWWIKDEGRIYRNDLRPLISDLDTLPFPDRSLFAQHALFYPERMIVLTSRGCLFNCAHCFNSYLSGLYGKESILFRRRSVKNVIEELRQLKKRYPLKFLIFDDSTFNVYPEWVSEFSREYGEHIRLPFCCAVRADLVDEKGIGELKRCGCHTISMGIEVGDDVYRQKFLEKMISRKQIINAANIIKGYGIRLRTTNMIGVSAGRESLNNDIETIRLNIACRVDYSYASLLQMDQGGRLKGRLADDVMTKDQHKLYQRLHYLFPLFVEFPWFLPLAHLLIRMPLGRFYRTVFLVWHVYCNNIRLFNVGFPILLKRLFLYARYTTHTLLYFRKCSY